MTIETSTLVNGISACSIFIISVPFFIKFLIRYKRERKGLLPFVCILFITFPFFYLGPVVTFLSLIITSHNIPVLLYAQLSYTVAPIAITNTMYLGFTLFNPDKKKIAFYLFMLSAIPYYICLFGFPNQMIELSSSSVAALDNAGFMIDISIISVLFAINAIYILSMVFILTGGCYYLQQKITGFERKKIRYLACGYLILGLGFILENAIGSQGDLAKIAARILVLIAIFLFYFGFSSRKSKEQEKQKVVVETGEKIGIE